MTKRPLVSVDVETSGPVPGYGDLVSFGAVIVEPGLERRHHSGLIRSTCDRYVPETYDLLKMTREEHVLASTSLTLAGARFIRWLRDQEPEVDRFIMISDNPGFDFAWVNYMLIQSGIQEWQVFGHSARRIGDAWAGLRGDSRNTQGWKKLRKTSHDHNPLNDAVGNAEAWLAMWELYGKKR